MRKNLQRALQSLDLEERILNGATVAALVFLFFPWLSGQFLGSDPVSYSGLQFYVSYVGATILILHVVILLITFLPLLGGPSLVQRSMRATVRMWIAIQAAVLTVASLSVLTRVTYEFRGLELRYGVYFSLVFSLIAALYAFLQWQEERRNDVPNEFHHPEDHVPAPAAPLPDLRMQATPPPPPPPPPMRAEDHHLRM